MKLVNIVLATYKPNLVYFEKLLCSLNNQSYPNIDIIIRDDSDDDATFTEISELVKKIITNFNYTLLRNDRNVGSNKTFEMLTKDAKGDFIAYCDQDDIWEKGKISKLVKCIEKENSILCYSDLSIIDKNDILLAKSFRDINIRLKHMYADGLFGYFLRRNSVTGCTMLINSKIAKEAIPFCHEYYVHDHWLALYASMKGKISYVEEPLVRYRIHDNNQIGASMLKGINNKKDYLNKKLFREREKYEYLLNNYGFNAAQKKLILEMYEWTQQRIDFFQNKSFIDTINMMKGIKRDWQLIALEIIINFAPERAVNKLFKIIKKRQEDYMW